MDARIQQRIAPPVAKNSKDLNDLKMSPQAASPGGKSNDVDFKSLLMNSNRETRQSREAMKNGDLSGAKNYQDFLDALNKQTQRDGMPKNTLDKDDFLNLFVTQLQNQDPLNPKDGAEMAAQLAQFNSLEQMLNLNTTLAEVSQKTSRGHSLEFVNFIGKEVSIKDGRAKMTHGSLSQANFRLDFPVGRAKLDVRDSKGAVVATRELGALSEGSHPLNWDGLDHAGERVPDGIYTFGVTAYGKGDSEVPVEVSSRVKITGVNMQDEASAFYTDLGKIGIADIVEIGEQGFRMDGAQELQDPASQALKAKEAEQGSMPAAPTKGPGAAAAPAQALSGATPAAPPALASPGVRAAATAPRAPKPSPAGKPAKATAEAATPANSRPAFDASTPYATSEALNRYQDQAQAPAASPQVQARG